VIKSLIFIPESDDLRGPSPSGLVGSLQICGQQDDPTQKITALGHPAMIVINPRAV
jgi:hypothetical protein